jgi:hypothetical protein
MLNKSYKYQGNTSVDNDEAVAVCETVGYEKSSSDRWNPNVPFIGTQEEWWEHFHQIEQGEFSTWEEHKKKFNVWKQEYLASLM